MSRARVTVPISAELIQHIHEIYLPNCRFIVEASLSHPVAPGAIRRGNPDSWIVCEGSCRSSEVWYVRTVRHLNAIDFNLAYNQLTYCMFAGIVSHSLLPELAAWDIATYLSRKSESTLIVNYDANFKRPIGAGLDFRLRLTLYEVIPKPEKRLLLCRTRCTADADDGGHFTARVLLAIKDWGGHPSQ